MRLALLLSIGGLLGGGCSGGSEMGCVPNDLGGRECATPGGCPYTCCRGGVVATCTIPFGYECGGVAPTLCGADTCVAPGESCPDAG